MSGATEGFTSVGTIISIALALPATFDATGFAAVAGYTEIGEVDNIPEFGPEQSVQKRTPLASGIVRKRKGSTDNGEMSISAAMVRGDAGHVKCNTARGQDGPASIKIEYQDGTIEYFTALVTSYKRSIGGADSWTNCTIGMSLDSDIVTVLAP